MKLFTSIALALSLTTFACGDDKKAPATDTNTTDVSTQEDVAVEEDTMVEEDVAVVEDTMVEEDVAVVEDTMVEEDVAVVEDTTVEEDTTTPSCTVECGWNDDCEANERCEDTPNGEFAACCVVGERGTGAAGDACTGSNDCAIGLCVEELCTEACENDEGCTTEGLGKCSIFGFCIPASE